MSITSPSSKNLFFFSFPSISLVMEFSPYFVITSEMLSFIPFTTSSLIAEMIFAVVATLFQHWKYSWKWIASRFDSFSWSSTVILFQVSKKKDELTINVSLLKQVLPSSNHNLFISTDCKTEHFNYATLGIYTGLFSHACLGLHTKWLGKFTIIMAFLFKSCHCFIKFTNRGLSARLL